MHRLAAVISASVSRHIDGGVCVNGSWALPLGSWPVGMGIERLLLSEALRRQLLQRDEGAGLMRVMLLVRLIRRACAGHRWRSQRLLRASGDS